MVRIISCSNLSVTVRDCLEGGDGIAFDSTYFPEAGSTNWSSFRDRVAELLKTEDEEEIVEPEFTDFGEDLL